MRYTEIYYTVNGDKEYVDVVRQKVGWEENYIQNVLNRVESIVSARDEYGKQCAVITDIRQYNTLDRIIKERDYDGI